MFFVGITEKPIETLIMIDFVWSFVWVCDRNSPPQRHSKFYEFRSMLFNAIYTIKEI